MFNILDYQLAVVWLPARCQTSALQAIPGFPVVSCSFGVLFSSVKSLTFLGFVLVWSVSDGSNVTCMYFSLSKGCLVCLNTIY